MTDMDQDQFTSPCELSPAEQIAYQMIYAAAEANQPCPIGLDIEVAAGFNSTSMGPKTVRRLAEKGFIRVMLTGQRFRVVQVVATSKWTAPDPRQKTLGEHRPRRRASCPPKPADRKPYKGAR